MNPDEILFDVVENDLDGFIRWYCINARDEWYTGKTLYENGNKLLFGSPKEQGRKISDMGLLELDYYNLDKNEKLAKRKAVLTKKWDALVSSSRVDILESIIAKAPVQKEWQADAWMSRIWRYAKIYNKEPQRHKLEALSERIRRRKRRKR